MKRPSLKPGFLTTVFPIAVLLLVGVLSITWFRGNFLIKGGDSFISLSPIYQLKIDSYMWFPVGGIQTVQVEYAYYPYLLFMAFLQNIGMSIVSSEKILFYLLFASSGLSMYYLVTVIFAHKEHKVLIGLTAALVYMMNPFTLINIWGSSLTTIVFAYPLLPLSLALFIKGLNTKQFRYTFLLLIAWLIFSAAAANPAFALPIWIMLLAYLVFYVVLERKNRVNLTYALKFSIILLVGWIFLNMFWILPIFPFINQSYAGAQVSGSYATVFLENSVTTNVLNSLRLQGYWTFYSSFFTDPYYLWASTYLTNVFFVAVGFVLPILAFLALLFKGKNKYVVFMTAVAVCGVFAIKQFNPPFGGLNLWMIEHVPYAGMFRDSYQKLSMIVAMSFAFLIGVSVFGIYSRLKKSLAFHNFASHVRFRKFVPVVFVVVFLLVMQLFMFPFWNGDVIYAGGQVEASARIQVPAYYSEAANWVNSQSGQFNLLYLPIYMGTFRYVWNNIRYGGSDALDEDFYHQDLIFAVWNDQSSSGMLAVDSMLSTNGSTDLFSQMLSVMNVKYIIVHNDFDPLFTPVPIAQLTADLDREAGITLVETFGQIQIYQNDFYKPSEVYASSSAVLVQGSEGNAAGDFDTVMNVAGINNVSVGNSALILSNQNELTQASGLSNTNFDLQNVTIPIYDGYADPFSWASLSSGNYAARYYSSWQKVVGDNDSYLLESPSFSSGWSSYNSTLVFVTTGDSPLTIASILADGSVASDVVGVWWETGWLGINSTVYYPIVIPANQNAIIQINQPVENLTLVTAPSTFAVPQSIEVDATLSYREVNPTEYSVSVNASRPFLLVFSEPYDANWVAAVDGKQVPGDLHFMANDVANAWYINETGSFTVTLMFAPQNLFYIGSAVSLTTLIFLVAYLGKNKIKTIYGHLRALHNPNPS